MQQIVELNIEQTKAVIGGIMARPEPRLPPIVVEIVRFLESLSRPQPVKAY
jgi:hypothetical protein